MGERDVAAVAATMQVLADETRLRLLLLLRDAELNVSALVERTGFDQPAVSHHLGILRRSRLVFARRAGKQVFYRLAVDAPSPHDLYVVAGTATISVQVGGGGAGRANPAAGVSAGSAAPL